MTVFNIFEDYKGRIWFTTYAGQLAYHYQDSIHKFKYNSELQKRFNHIYKSSFYVDREDNVYISAYEKGYFKISAKGVITQYHDSKRNNYKITDMEDSVVFLSFSFLDFKPSITLNIMDTPVRINTARPDKNARCIKQQSGSFLFACGHELIEILDSTNILNHLLPNAAIALMEDKDENVWLGTFEGGVLYYEDGDIRKAPRNYLKGLSISSIMQDAEAGYWFTTLENGVYYMPSDKFLTFDKRAGLSGGKVKAVITDGDNNIFAGLYKGVLLTIDDSITHSVDVNVSQERPVYINTLFFNQPGNTVHIGTSEMSYYVYEIGKSRILKSINAATIYDIVKGEKGVIWIGTHTGVGKLINGEWLWPPWNQNPISEPGTRVYALLEASTGALWVGGLQGLGKLLNGEIIPYDVGSELLKTRITDIVEVGDGVLCIATRGAGILFLTGDTVHQITSINGLASDNANHLYLDDSIIWVSTNGGLSKVTLIDCCQINYKVETYTTDDGLASNEVNQITKLGDDIWVATNKGLTYFNCEKVKPNTHSPPVYITGVNIVKRDTTVLPQYNLEYNQNYIVINYIGLSYKNTGKLQYRYQMEGVDSVWAITRNTSVQYPTLPHGDYIFKIKAINDDGYSSRASAEVRFSIAPPYWETGWFRALFVLILIAAAYTFFKVRILTYNRDVVREILMLVINMLRRKKHLFVKIDGRMVRIDPNEILWIKAAHNYVEIISIDKRYLVRSRMNTLEKNLPGKEHFIRVHRSYIVRIDKIDSIDKGQLIINSTSIPVSASFKTSVGQLRERLISINK